MSKASQKRVVARLAARELNIEETKTVVGGRVILAAPPTALCTLLPPVDGIEVTVCDIIND